MERIRVLDRFGEWTRERPVFLMGDFNSRPGSEVYNNVDGVYPSDHQPIFIELKILEE